MAVSAEARAAVRAAFDGRCGYCGVSETFVGGELEMDHVHPLAKGGSDEVENLVYACTACNRFKGDYAPASDAKESLRLLHPRRDDMRAHVAETAQGRLVGITQRGWFHIERLHLNRPQLIEMRHLDHVMKTHREELTQARQAEAHLRQENGVLRGENARLRAAIIELLRGGSDDQNRR